MTCPRARQKTRKNTHPHPPTLPSKDSSLPDVGTLDMERESICYKTLVKKTHHHHIVKDIMSLMEQDESDGSPHINPEHSITFHRLCCYGRLMINKVNKDSTGPCVLHFRDYSTSSCSPNFWHSLFKKYFMNAIGHLSIWFDAITDFGTENKEEHPSGFVSDDETERIWERHLSAGAAAPTKKRGPCVYPNHKKRTIYVRVPICQSTNYQKPYF